MRNFRWKFNIYWICTFPQHVENNNLNSSRSSKTLLYLSSTDIFMKDNFLECQYKQNAKICLIAFLVDFRMQYYFIEQKIAEIPIQCSLSTYIVEKVQCISENDGHPIRKIRQDQLSIFHLSRISNNISFSFFVFASRQPKSTKSWQILVENLFRSSIINRVKRRQP